MAFFGFGKEKQEGGSSELVLAYLEDAQRVRAPFLLKDKRKVDVSATIQGVDEEANTLSFQSSSGTFEKGAKLDFLFMQEGLRIGGTVKVVEVRSSLVVTEIPDSLELMERRKQSRARLNPKEGANVTALTSLFEGVGINGVIENISEGGCRIRVEKAMNLKDEKRLPLGTALLPKGQAFMLVKLNKVPKCPSIMELTGKVAYLDDSGGGLFLGIELEKPRADFASAIRNLVSSRSGAIPTSIPPKIRRKTATQEDSLLATEEDRSSRPVPAPKPPVQEVQKPVVEPEPVPEPAPEPPPPAVPAPAPEVEAPPRNLALLRLKKRTRAIVVMTSPAYGPLLKDFLLEDGYGRILLASNWNELAEAVRQPNVGMVFIDVDTSVLESFEMISKLHEEDSDLPPVIVAAQEVSRALVLAAHRSSVSQLVVKPYNLDESFSDLLEKQMGL